MRWARSCCFMRSAKYSPAGPPPMQTMFMDRSWTMLEV
jgi:hypothetical protein